MNTVLDKLKYVRTELLGISSAIRLDEPNDGRSSEGSLRGLKRTRARYALGKGNLDDAINDLESWQRILDHSWLLTMKAAQITVYNEEIRLSAATDVTEHEAISDGDTRSVFVDPARLSTAVTTPLPMCDAKSALVGEDLFILDAFVFANSPNGIACPIARDMRTLARNLRGNDSYHVGLMKCKGVMRQKAEEKGFTRFTIIFKAPLASDSPQSLRSALASGASPLSLSDTVQISQQLAASISQIHIFGFVHKNIRQETVLLWHKHGSSSMSSSSPSACASLVGFENFRLDGGMTAKVGDENWAKTLYRHPERYGQSPEQVYIMQHDIFSLGVCLLEIGLWRSLVEYGPSSCPMPSSLLGWQSQTPTRAELVLLKGQFVTLAQDKLPQRMGTTYASIVKTCLTCLDDDNKDFGDESEFLDRDGILVGVRYIEKVSDK